MSYQNDTTEGI